MSTEINEADSFLQQALQLSNLNDTLSDETIVKLYSAITEMKQ